MRALPRGTESECVVTRLIVTVVFSDPLLLRLLLWLPARRDDVCFPVLECVELPRERAPALGLWLWDAGTGCTGTTGAVEAEFPWPLVAPRCLPGFPGGFVIVVIVVA